MSCWSDYWAGGVLTSLPEDFGGNYDGEIAQFWAQQFVQIPDNGVVLDVCTGNGAVALLAAEASLQSTKPFSVHALDGAHIQPERAAQAHGLNPSLIERIEFIDQTPFEQYQATDETFDLIISQYGMEYCHWRLAAAQCQRLLKPSGRLVIVSHAVDSDILSTMQDEYADYQVVMNTGLTDALLTALTQGVFNRGLQTRLTSIVERIEQAKGAQASPLLNFGFQLAVQTSRLNGQQWAQYREPVRTAVNQLTQGYARLQQMLSVHERMLAHQPWTDCFVEAGLTRMDHGQLLYQQRHRVGDYHRLFKP
ncbi:MAG: class I SAM-dependent methyltransferase [Pseudomonadota bacterium]